jgi:C1A family cysteine protease
MTSTSSSTPKTSPQHGITDDAPIVGKGLGWVPDTPDFRDQYFSITAPQPLTETLPSLVDLRNSQLFSFPILDQGSLGSCTANAISAAITYAMSKQGKVSIQNLNMGVKPNTTPETTTAFFSPSRLFIYYNERVMENSVDSDAGAMIRDGIKSVNKDGACKETTWPYIIQQFATKPSGPAYKEGQNYQAIQYRRLDNTDITQLKSCLYQGFPFVFGFSVYQSFMSQGVARTGLMPMPSKRERLLGGHAVLAVGYDDSKQVFIVRNSWGPNWGDKGYFYMPYKYITNDDLAADLEPGL